MLFSFSIADLIICWLSQLMIQLMIFWLFNHRNPATTDCWFGWSHSPISSPPPPTPTPLLPRCKFMFPYVQLSQRWYVTTVYKKLHLSTSSLAVPIKKVDSSRSEFMDQFKQAGIWGNSKKQHHIYIKKRGRRKGREEMREWKGKKI